uniref:Cadherin domain-containing protein n=1 Tax=Candidatus Berkiella aquae TaxID=295108 RepID=A0A0Q9YPW8_9GAMM
MVIKTVEEGIKQDTRTQQNQASHEATPAMDAVLLLNSGLMDIFVDANQNFLPTEELSVPFQEAFQVYAQMDQKQFLAEIEEAIAKLAVNNEQGPDFLNLEFEQLFEISVEEGGSTLGKTISSGSEGSVNSLERFLNMNNPLTQNDEEILLKVESQPQALSINIVQSYSFSTPPTATPNPTENAPKAPPIDIPQPDQQVIFTETLLNTQQSFTISGNITEPGPFNNGTGATFGAGLLTMDVFFNVPARAGSSETHTAGVTTLTTPEGNVFVFDRTTGDYSYTLNNPILHLQSVWGSNYVDALQEIFTDRFVYSITDITLQTAVGNITIYIQDDHPEANVKNNSVDETAMYVNGNEAKTGNLLSDGIASTFGADGGKVTLINGVSDASDGTIDGFINVTTSYGHLIVDTATGGYTYSLDPALMKLIPQAFADTNKNVNDVLTYELTDADGDKSTSTLTVNIDLNESPVAIDDTNTTGENTALVVIAANGVLSNDTDPDVGDTKIVSAVDGVSANVGKQITLSSGALFTLNADGSYSFEPTSVYDSLAVGKTAQEVITYTMKDAEGLTSSATLTITITGVNDAPLANDQAISATEDGASVGPILFAADDVDSDDNQASLTYTVVSNLAAGQGTVTNNNDGTFTYNPGSDFQGLAAGEKRDVTFTYMATDAHGADSAVKAVTITVTGVNDAPTANDQTISATEDGAPVGPILFSADDVDSDNNQANLTYTIVSNLAAGQGTVANNNDGTFTYNPGSDFQGLAVGEKQDVTFTYMATDAHGADSAVKTVTITVTGVNDAPTANDQAISATEDGAPVGPILFSADDVDSDNNQTNLTYTIVNNLLAGQGTVTNNNDGTFTYDPGNDFQALGAGQKQDVTFTYMATDAHGADSAVKTVTITVIGENDAPVAALDVASTSENTPVTVDVLANDTDIDNGDVPGTFNLNSVLISSALFGIDDVTISTATANVVSNQLVFDPGTDFDFLADGETATVVVSYQMQDLGGLTSTSTATITVTGVNDAPVANAVSTSGLENTTIPITLAGNDVDGTILNFRVDVLPTDGILYKDNLLTQVLSASELITATGNNAQLYFVPDADFNGTANFDYVAIDNNGLASNTAAHVDIDVTGGAPVILDLNNNNNIELISAEQSSVTLNTFHDMNGTNQIGWVQPGDGLLIYDYQGDGKVTNMDEFALTAHSPDAKTDLDALRLTFDTNHDGIFNVEDTSFGNFGVWQDKNSNGISDSGEYKTLMEMGIISINVNSDHQSQIIEGNTLFGYTSYQTVDGVSHVAADVSLNIAPTQTQTLSMPDIIGDHAVIDFSSMTSTSPQSTDNQSILNTSEMHNIGTESTTNTDMSTAEVAAVSAATDIQSITQQLEQQHQETPLS